MHPGPVNRGVELAAEVDRLAAGGDRRPGRGRRGRAHGRPLRAARRRAAGTPAPTPRCPTPGAAARVSPPPLTACPPRPPTCWSAARTCSTRARGLDAPHRRARPRRRDRRARRAGRADGARGRRDRRRRAAATCFPASSTRTCTCARPARSTRRTSRPAPAPPPRAATARSSRCRTPSPPIDSAPVLRSLPDARRRDARVPVGFMAADHARPAGPELTEMAELRDAGALGLHRRRPARSPAPACCAAPCSTSGCAAAWSRCTRRTRRCRATASCTRATVSAAARARRDPVDLASRRWSPATPPSPRYEDGRIHVQHLSAAESVRGGRGGQGGRRARHRRGHAAPPDAHRRGRPRRSTRALKFNPPLRAESDRLALIEGLRDGTSTASRPTTRRTRRTRRRCRSRRRRWARPGWRPRSPRSTPS